jgi:hypothetical protein
VRAERLTGKSIIAWSAEREPPLDALWRDAYHRQMSFVLHDLPRAWRSAPTVEVLDTILAVGFHRAKGIDLPIYQIDLPTLGITAMLRGDLHRWTVAVKREHATPIDSAGLFDQERVAQPWESVGIDTGWRFGSYAANPARFTAIVTTDFQVYTLLHMLVHKEAA